MTGHVEPQSAVPQALGACELTFQIARLARDMRAGTGISLESRIARPRVNREVINTDEGTHDTRPLILASVVIGIATFRSPMETTNQCGALSAVRMLDLSPVLAGPWSSQLLADLGADVIKVERPGTGDDTRAWGPPWLSDAHGKPTSQSAYYLSANRNKRSVTIDIAQPDGQDLIRRLAGKADILLENYKVGGLSRYGLDYASVKAINPRLIYCSITGFGQSGPYATRAG